MKKRIPLMALSLALLASCQVKTTTQVDTPASVEVTATDAEPVTQTESGLVGGYIENGISIFKGIPYAKAERFMAPQPVEKWEGVRSSRAYGSTCPQAKRMGWYNDEIAFAFDWDDGYTNEDCLRLNVWTKGLKDGKKRPVMVWLHGGGYSAGSSQELASYDGTNLAKKGDVVVVSVNHRLNVLGFLDLSAYGEKYAQSGNAGLLDLVEALKWVNKNIEAFGGDPANVTIFGQSGGGGKVTTLCGTPAAKGLFQKAIVESGSIRYGMNPKYSRQIGAEVMAQLGLSAAKIDELKNVPYEKLLAVGDEAIKKVKAEAIKADEPFFIFGWAPVADGNILPTHSFGKEAPEQSKDVPMLIGTTLHEMTASTYVKALRTATLNEVKKMLATQYGEKVDDYIAAFNKVYPKAQPKDYVDVDFRFRPEAIKQADMKATQKGAPVYVYQFTWESPVLDGMFRATHCMELPFVFDNIARCNRMTGGGKEAQALADKMSQAWINFARTGNPNAEGLPEWEPYTIDKGATMIFDNTCEVKHHHDKALLDFVSDFPVSKL